MNDYRVISQSEEVYRNFEYVASVFNDTSVLGFDYKVENVYLDFSSKWEWTTITATNKKGNSHQILSPRDWERIYNAKNDADLDVVVAYIKDDEYFQDKEEKRKYHEGVVHTDEEDNVNGLKLASLLKVGDVFYDDHSQHRLKVIAVREDTPWATMIAVDDLDSGTNKEMRMGNLAIVELAGDNDIELEVDDEPDIEWHDIDDYFDM